MSGLPGPDWIQTDYQMPSRDMAKVVRKACGTAGFGTALSGSELSVLHSPSDATLVREVIRDAVETHLRASERRP